MTSSSKIVFFLRHYNDIDHVVPVIHQWSTVTDVCTDVVVTTDRRYLSDFRIEFLRREHGIEARHVDDVVRPSESTTSRSLRTLKRAGRLLPSNVPEYVWRATIGPGATSEPDQAHVEDLFDALFDGTDRGILAFDWHTAYSRETIGLAKGLCALGAERGFSTVSLPHGDSPYYNRMNRLDTLSYGDTDAHFEAGTFFDRIVVPNELCGRRYRPYVPDNRIAVLGSPRYSDTWLDVLPTLLPEADLPRPADTLKLVLFPRNYDYPVFWEELEKALRLIDGFPDVHLVVKHHTRSSAPEIETAKLENVEEVFDEVHSATLLQWADAVIDLGTSVVYESIKRHVPVLAMEYLHANVSSVAHHMEGASMECRDDLYETIERLRTEDEYTVYSDAERRRFVEAMLDVPDSDVLSRYVSFLEGLIEEEP